MAHDRRLLSPYIDIIGSRRQLHLWPLPPRIHNLTPPQQASGPILHPQHQSYFLSLPHELCHQIYIDVLGTSNQPLHIFRTKDRLTCVRCRMPHEPEAQRHGCLGWLESTEGLKGYLHFIQDFDDVRRLDDVPMGVRGVLELLRTCRLTYAEGIRLLYSAPCFLVDSIDTLMAWKERVLPSRFNDIRALDLKYGLICGHRGSCFPHAAGLRWRAHWEMIGEMKVLKHLRVRLGIMNPAYYPHRNLSPANEREILMPLESVTGPEDFVVIVSWTVECDEDGRGADQPRKRSFRLLTIAGDNEVHN